MPRRLFFWDLPSLKWRLELAITKHLARLLVCRHQLVPIRGRVLLLGRQTVYLSPDQALQLLHEVGVSPRTAVSVEIDNNTSVGRSNNYISDRSFFGLFTDAEILAIDHSSYENADLIANLCEPLSPNMPCDFNFVYNGSVLDNVFDPANAMRNITELTAPGGTIFHYEGVAHWLGAYIKFMPDWFFDYYAVNNFKSCYTLLCHYKNIHNSPWEISEWWPFESEGDSFKLAGVPPAPDGHDCVVVIVAEKGLESTSGKFPVQGPYRLDHSEYIEAYKRFRSHSVPFPIGKLDGFELRFVNSGNIGKTTKRKGWIRKLKRRIKNRKRG